MFSKNSPFVSRLLSALFCLVGSTAMVFNLVNVSAQTTRFNAIEQNAPAAPVLTATLTDAFPDPDGDGKARPGAEITYTSTITNNGTTNATNVIFTSPVDGNSALVANSVAAQRDFSPFVVRCAFSTASGGGGGCNVSSSAYDETNTANYTIIGGQGSRLNVAATNVSYNSGSGVFAFDATVQNLLGQSFGTIDGTTLDAAGVRLFPNSATVTTGNGLLSVANADGTATFTAPNQPFFQYNQIIAPNLTSSAKTVQLNVPNTVNSFTVDFLISAKVAVKLVINEVLVNPGGTISDANGEWFEVYNAGLFPVNMQNFLINDLSVANPTTGCSVYPCERDAHTIASSIIIQPGGFKTFGNTVNTTNNGGVPVNYAYGVALSLANSQDGVRLQSPNAVVLDKVIYASAAISAQNGISRELKDPSFDNSNMDDANWQNASVSTVYGPGGRGTPGAVNTGAPSRLNTNTSELSSLNTNLALNETDGGETVAVTIGTLAPGQSATVTCRQTIANQVTAPQIASQGTVAGDNFVSVVTDDPATGTANDATVTQISFAPTTATASVAGRVTNADGRGVSRVTVSMTDSQGATRTVRTSTFGYFRFEAVSTAQTYVFEAFSKQHQFTPQIITVNNDLADLHFTVEPLTSNMFGK